MMFGKVLPVASAVLLSLGTSACTAETSAIGERATGTTTAVDGSDIGNGMPAVTFDGQLVRRRVVLALTGEGADPTAVRPALERAAFRLGMDLTDLPGTVLDPSDLEGAFPELTVALPEGRTATDGRALLAGSVETAALPAESVRLADVLVHDLAFTVPTPDPLAVARFTDAEGILSDVLGVYEIEPGKGELSVGYTGPLLSDGSIGAVRVGMARAAGTEPSAVEVIPRTSTGEGVRLPEAPSSAGGAPEGASQGSSTEGSHGEAARGTASVGHSAADAPAAPFPLVAVGLAVAWVAFLVALGRWRARPPSGVLPGRE